MSTHLAAVHALITPLLNGERLIGLNAAARAIPGYRDNRHVCPSTVLRWILKGTRTLSGAIVRLEAVRCGKRWLTSTEAIARFSSACSAMETDISQPVTVAQPSRAASTASKELDRLGVKST